MVKVFSLTKQMFRLPDHQVAETPIPWCPCPNSHRHQVVETPAPL
ncbi:uncharacterized protein G2W53_010107 [Senna tora]|uniref:Uncharacterized protein n=1 Tax=Senna tora TaxID=362788 RepID=A0A834WZI8_9FABA|nr:uncharacterized protein G2W53_010107 [Senna tora]